MEPLNQDSQLNAIADLLTEKESSADNDQSGDDVVGTPAEDSSDESVEENEVESESGGEEKEEDLTWANALGVDDRNVVLDEDGNLTGINVKVDGVTSTVSVKDLIAGYQYNASNTNKAKTLAEARKEVDTFKQVAIQTYGEKLQAADNLVAFVEKKLLAPYENVDWERFRMENPGEYAATITDLQRQINEIETIKQAVGKEKQNIQSTMNEEQQKQYGEYLQNQVNFALEKNPSWAKPEVFKQTLNKMETFLGEAYGFTPEEFHTVQDARLLEIVKDAMAYHEGTKIAKEKLDVKKPTFLKGGQSTKPVSKLQQLTKKAKSATGYNKQKLEVDAITELLMNG
jgi:hypothetical protein